MSNTYLTIEDILREVSMEYNISEQRIVSIHRDRPLPEARAMYFYLAMKHTNNTQKEIAALINRDRSTCTVQGNKIGEIVNMYADLYSKVANIEEVLLSVSMSPYYIMAANFGGYEPKS